MPHLRLVLLVWVTAAVLIQPVSACKCGLRQSACKAFADADLVFIGRVDSVDPEVDRWGVYPASRRFQKQLKARFGDFESDGLPPFTVVKEIYAKWVSARHREAVLKSTTLAELKKVVLQVWAEGVRTRLTVHRMFKGQKQRSIDIWTESSDCQVFLLPGETSLVYADLDENRRFTVGGCGRTVSLGEAGEDLAYLHFVEQGGPSARLHGLVTSDEAALKQRPRIWKDVPTPVSGLTLYLEAGNAVRLSGTNRNGEFFFDGLTGGEYTLSAFGEDLLENYEPLMTRRLKIPDKGCVAEEIYLPKSAEKRK